jgi:hypothetical protein
MTRHRTGPGRARRPIPAGTDLYAYGSTYGRRRRPGVLGWVDRHRPAVALAAALAVMPAYTAACVYVLDQLFPARAGGYWLAGLTAAAAGALLALVLWARRG